MAPASVRGPFLLVFESFDNPAIPAMLKHDLNILACPACRRGDLQYEPPQRALPLPPGFDPETHYWEGKLICRDCRRAYALLEGVACLGILDEGWRIPLKETTSKLSLSLRFTRPVQWGPGRE